MSIFSNELTTSLGCFSHLQSSRIVGQRILPIVKTANSSVGRAELLHFLCLHDTWLMSLTTTKVGSSRRSAIKGKTIGLVAPGGLEMTSKFSNWGVHNLEDEMKHETAPAVTNCSSSKEKSCAKNCRWAIHKRKGRKLINFHLPSSEEESKTPINEISRETTEIQLVYFHALLCPTVASQWLKII